MEANGRPGQAGRVELLQKARTNSSRTVPEAVRKAKLFPSTTTSTMHDLPVRVLDPAAVEVPAILTTVGCVDRKTTVESFIRDKLQTFVAPYPHDSLLTSTISAVFQFVFGDTETMPEGATAPTTTQHGGIKQNSKRPLHDESSRDAKLAQLLQPDQRWDSFVDGYAPYDPSMRKNKLYC